jgi:GTP pyrophosphokinase
MESLFSLIQHPLSDAERALIAAAYTFSEEKHSGQTRNSGEPYMTHALAVAQNCAILGMDTETIVAALLHDVIEDTETSEAEIEERFGSTVLFLVKGVTKLGKVKYRGQERHVESMRKFFVAMAEDVRVLIIKLADRLHNVSTLSHVRPDKQKRIALETIEVHAALAGRMGMEKLKGQLEDYSFPYAFPKEFEETRKIMDAIVPEAQKVVAHVHDVVQKTLAEFDIHHATVDSRVKHTYSTYRKLKKYNMNAEQVYDIVALRVITNSVANCYQILGLIHMLWKPIPKRIKDYIALPKANGYQSLHTTVLTDEGIVEIQIRTEDMHREAELGIASHFLYKETSTSKGPIPSKKLAWLDELKELHTVVKNPSRFIEQLRMDFFRDRIFVFSPKGDVIDLPEDATPIDFAFAIHSTIGQTTSSAHINGKMAPLGAKLHNGDIVEILTSKNAKPTSKWLDYAKTNLARRKIRSYIEEHGGLLQKFLTRE